MIRNEYQRYKTLTRRSFLLGAGKLALLAMLASRMYYLQVLESKKYLTLSDSNRIKVIPIPPLRGIIFDRYKNILAVNKSNYRILIDKQDDKHLESTLHKIFKLLTLDEERIREIKYKVEAQKNKSTLVISENVSWEELSIIEVHKPDLPGVYIEVGQIRFYPYHYICAHLIGYVGTISKQELETAKITPHPDFKIGKNGVEKIYDELLQGEPGYKQVEVDAYGSYIRELSQQESSPGNELNLSISIKLQDLVYNLIIEQDAAVVAIDSWTGEILAMCSTPSFDPNKFTQGISSNYWEKIVANSHHPLINKNISQQYPPGSVFKLIVSLAALNAGIDQSTSVHCTGYIYVGNHKFHCVRHTGHGNLTMPEAIQYSCNVYFYYIAKKIGFEKIAETAKMFGLGDKFNLGLVGEVPGLIPNRAWKRQKLKQEWRLGDTINCAIGHGYVNVTPLQLAVMTARIATGKNVKPTLLAVKEQNFEPLNVTEESIKVVQKGMDMVVNREGGSAFRHRILDPEISFAAKTGTAQVVSIQHDEKGKAVNENATWDTAHHGVCVGYAPVNNPRFVCAVVAEHGVSGARSAAPLVREVLLKIQQIYKQENDNHS